MDSSVHIYSRALSSLSSSESGALDKELHADGLFEKVTLGSRSERWREGVSKGGQGSKGIGYWVDLCVRTWCCSPRDLLRSLGSASHKYRVGHPGTSLRQLNSSAPPGYTSLFCVWPQDLREASGQRVEKYEVWGVVRHPQAALGEAGLRLLRTTHHKGAWSENSTRRFEEAHGCVWHWPESGPCPRKCAITMIGGLVNFILPWSKTAN